MNAEDFEGSLVLEKLAEIGRVDAFFEAVDADDFAMAKQLMTMAGVDFEMIEEVLKQMASADGHS